MWGAEGSESKIQIKHFQLTKNEKRIHKWWTMVAVHVHWQLPFNSIPPPPAKSTLRIMHMSNQHSASECSSAQIPFFSIKKTFFSSSTLQRHCHTLTLSTQNTDKFRSIYYTIPIFRQQDKNEKWKEVQIKINTMNISEHKKLTICIVFCFFFGWRKTKSNLLFFVPLLMKMRIFDWPQSKRRFSGEAYRERH